MKFARKHWLIIVIGIILFSVLARLSGLMNTQITITEYSLPMAKSMPFGITQGSDGGMWFIENNKIGRIDLASHKITEYPFSARSSPVGGYIVVGSDGSLWFPEMVLGSAEVTMINGMPVSSPYYQTVGRIDPTTGKIDHFPIRTMLSIASTEVPGMQGIGGLLGAIAAGSDGGIWVIANHAPPTKFAHWYSNLVRIDPVTHAIDEYGVPRMDIDFAVTDITNGPDNALWGIYQNAFEGKEVTSLIRFDLKTHHTTTHLVSSPHTGLSGIAIGSDGGVWVTEATAKKVARIDPTTKQFTEYPTSITPARIASGPDGALWFLDKKENKLGRIDPITGIVTDSTLFKMDGLIGGIASGSDGALWITEFSADKISRIELKPLSASRNSAENNAKVVKQATSVSPAIESTNAAPTASAPSVTASLATRVDVGTNPPSNELATPVTATVPAAAQQIASSQSPESDVLGKYKVSFDCSKASTAVEKLVCSTSILSQLDGLLGTTSKARTSNPAFGIDKALYQANGRAWIRKRNSCIDASCLETIYRARITELCEMPVVSGVHPIEDCEAIQN